MSGARRSYHHGDLRRALLDATLALAAELGPAGVTLRQAADRAGVSRTAPYRHFDDKAAMLAAASEEGFRLLHARMLEGSHAFADDPLGRLGAWARCYVEFAVARSAHFRLMFGQGSPRKSATEALQAAARDTFQLLFQTVETAVRIDRLRDVETRELALEIWSVAHGIAVLAIEGQTAFLGVPPERAPQVAQMAVTALCAGLAIPPARRRRRLRGAHG